MKCRPKQFHIDSTHNFANGLVFGGLGGYPGTKTMFDSSRYSNNGTLTNMTPSEDWVFIPEDGVYGISCDSGKYVALPAVGGMRLPDGSPFTVVYTYSCQGNNTGALFTWGVGSSYRNTFTSSLWRTRSSSGANTQDTYLAGWSGLFADGRHALACVYTGADKVIYHDGSVFGSSIGVGAVGTSSVTAIRINDAVDVHGDDNTIHLFMFYNRVLSPLEIADLADPSNTMLSGLIKYTIPRSFVSFAGSSAPVFYPAWAINSSQLIL